MQSKSEHQNVQHIRLKALEISSGPRCPHPSCTTHKLECLLIVFNASTARCFRLRSMLRSVLLDVTLPCTTVWRDRNIGCLGERNMERKDDRDRNQHPPRSSQDFSKNQFFPTNRQQLSSSGQYMRVLQFEKHFSPSGKYWGHKDYKKEPLLNIFLIHTSIITYIQFLWGMTQEHQLTFAFMRMLPANRLISCFPWWQNQHNPGRYDVFRLRRYASIKTSLTRLQ